MGKRSRAVRAIACICGISLSAAAIEAGCGSDSFTPGTSTDGGTDDATAGDADSVSDAPADTGPGPCISPPPNQPADEVAFCSVFAAISSRCNDCQDCQKENAGSCATFGDQLSTAFRNAIVSCASEIDCADFESQSALAQDPCISALVFDAGPTAGQIAAKNAYCATCVDASANGAENCATFFGSPDAGGVGSIVLFSSDDVAATVASGCGTCDGITYPLCTAGKLCSGVPKDQCGKGLCK